MAKIRPGTSGLVFHQAEPGAVLAEGASILRIDGYWKTPAGRTLFIACSAPGSILRNAPTSERRSPESDIHGPQA